MAITAATQTSDFAGFIQPHEAAPIFNDAEKISVFQRLIRRVPLAASGETIPVITSKPVANWVGEGGQKPATSMGLGKLSMTPKKLAAIAVYSAEVIRAQIRSMLVDLLQMIGQPFREAQAAIAETAGEE